jgi:hypothetical protein
MPVKNSVALYSSLWTCAWAVQKTSPPGRASAAMLSELAAVPVATKWTSTSVSKISENRRAIAVVSASPP